MKRVFYFRYLILFLSLVFCSCSTDESITETEEETEAPLVTLTFNVEGNLNVIAAQELETGSRATKPADLVKEGFTFDGWYLDGVLFDFNTLVEKNITLIAQFTQVEETESDTAAHLLPEDFVADLGKGFDVTWSEFTKYMNLYSEQAVIDFAAAGFKNVRIRMGEGNPDAEFLNRLKMQVDHCLKHGIYPILAYQGKFLEEEAATDAEAREHLVTWWRTMAAYFKDYPDELTFNILIEISGNYKDNFTAMNSFYVDVLKAIRESNPHRIVIFPPVKISDPEQLENLKIPGEDDKYTMAEWHFYAAGPNTTVGNKKYWNDGSTAMERDNVKQPIQTALDWMQKTGYKTWVGAWMAGNYNKGNDFTIPQQVAFASFMTRELDAAQIPWSINAGNKYYDYENQKWFNVTSDAAGIPVRDAILDPRTIALYKDSYYNGSGTRLQPGNYDAAALKNLGLYKTSRSMMIPFDFEVTVYSGDSFDGSAKVLTQTQADFTDFEIASFKVNYLNSY
ncbi:hypothetical protein CJ305_03755 [Leeuwenhoekiella nanhaiensis]|uniref:Glycoside hydrolase family 5 domain-containing protein n=1 Tax=Leeuwenhoekiella nanhaiensis TaxID=1655491 RepID=A0A2G1VUG2_9FLAO|nr:hypothetical protein CJ305_03755 [Leeuwenhoekiella nanhaiensis]